ncbi:transposase [Spiroplasma gladiatoris]|uniref:Transposase n=1 Tax=Spiroplasma gladiatoris TaxID=2143 RepID=A0A4P7AGF8_9MOLU|nr:hypothetical protein [Spiroplasma gladiatoris]QBQ07455.1 transposase [Spiroplasma gladiatoris]
MFFLYRTTRNVNKGSSINYENKKWFVCSGYEPLYLKPKTKIMVMKTQDNKYYYSIGNDVYNLIEIDDHRLHGNKYTIKKEELESIKPSKMESP